MDGVFCRRKPNIWLVLLLLCGILFVVLYVFLNVVDPEATSELRIFLILGILCGSAAIPAMLLNRGGHIRVEENIVDAKYHWFGRLHCSMDDIEFVLPQTNTLTVLLKNGKRHVMMGVENSWALAAAIRRRSFELEREEPESIYQQLSKVQAARKSELWRLLGGIAMLFISIFIAVLLTGGKDMQQFSSRDWIAFFAMGLVELILLMGVFWLAYRCGKPLLPIELLKYRLRGAIIATQPLPTSCPVAVYTDENYTGRIVICGFPNSESVFYCVQQIFENSQLETVYTSGVFETVAELPPEGFSELIDITALV